MCSCGERCFIHKGKVCAGIIRPRICATAVFLDEEIQAIGFMPFLGDVRSKTTLYPKLIALFILRGLLLRLNKVLKSNMNGEPKKMYTKSNQALVITLGR